MTLRDSTVSGQLTRRVRACYGGGIYNEGTMVIRHSTISGNRSLGHGE